MPTRRDKGRLEGEEKAPLPTPWRPVVLADWSNAMEDGMTPSRRMLSVQERSLIRRALRPERVSEEDFEVLLCLFEECALTTCEKDFSSPYEAAGHESAPGCPGIMNYRFSFDERFYVR